MLIRGLISGIVTAVLIAHPVFSAKQKRPVLLPCRPIDAGATSGPSKYDWFIALLERQVRFRLSPLGQIALVDKATVKEALPALDDYSRFLEEEVFHDIAPKVNASHLLVQKFEAMSRQKSISYYAEIVTAGERRIVAQTEMDISYDNLSAGVDSCLMTLLSRFGVRFSSNAKRFMHLPVTGASYRSLKSLGELFLKEHDSTYSRKTLAHDYEKLIRKDPFMLLANHAAGKLFFGLRQYDKSAKYLKELLDLTPIHTSLYLTLIQSYRLARRYNEALKIALLCERNRLTTVPYLLEKALALEGLQQTGAAFSAHQQVLMLDAGQPVSLLFMAGLRNDEKKYSEGKSFAEKALKRAPENARTYYELGRSLMELKKYTEAEDALGTADQLQKGNPYIHELLGDLAMINRQFRKAFGHYQTASDKRPREFDIYLKAGRALEADGKQEIALKLLYSISDRFASKPLLRRQIGLLEYATGSLDSACRSLTMYAAVKPDDGHVLLTLGKAYLQKNDNFRARKYFRKALPLVNDKITCRLALAEVELRNRNHLAAMKLLQGIIREKPVKEAHRMMGEAFLIAGKKGEALKHFKKERELHGDTIPVQEQIAQLHYDLGFYIPARQEFARLLKLAPEHANAYYHLALCALRSKNTGEASEHMKKAVALGKGTPGIFHEAGSLYLTCKTPGKAVHAFKRCIALAPTHEKALCDLADTYLSLGNDTAAAAINVRLFAINSKQYAPRLAHAGHLYRKHGQETAAVSAYRQFLDKGFADFSVNAGYASILYNAGTYDKVVPLLENMAGEFANDTLNLLMLAHAYCETDRPLKALPWLEKLRNITIGIPLEARLSARASEIAGDTITAIAMYKRLLSFPPDKHHTDEAYHLGILYEAKNLTENAVSRYELNLRESPDDLRSHERLGRIYITRKDWKNARRVLETALAFPHVTAPIQKMLAHTYSALNDMTKAAKLYTVYLSRVKNDLSSWKALASIYFSQKKFAEAVGPLKMVTRLEPDGFDGWYRLGASYIETEKFKTAITPLGRARALNPGNIPAIELTARCYRHAKQTTTLTSILREWIALDPKRYDIKMEIGSILLEEKEVAEATKMLTEAVRFIPTEPQPHLLLARAYELQAKDSLRYVHLTNALKFGQDRWKPHYEMARYYLAGRLGHDAERHLKKALAINPSHARGHFDYGSLLAARGDFTNANMEFSLAIESEPHNPLYLVLHAFTECKTGNIRTGIRQAEKAANMSQADPEVLYWAGQTYRAGGRSKEARESFETALAINESCAECLEGLGDLYMEKVQFKPAAKYYFKAWEKGGYNPKRVYKLGNALLYDRKYVEAKDFFETLLNKNNRYDDAKYRLVVAYCELGELENARKILPSFRAERTPWMQLAQGKIYETQKNYDAAYVAYDIARRIDPKHPDVSAGLGRIFRERHQYDSAIIHLSNASAADTLNMQAMMDLGEIFKRMGNPLSAIQYYIEVDKKYPYFPHVQLRIAAIRSEQKAHETAIRYLQRGLEYHPNDTNLYFMLGKEYALTDNYREAISSFKQALKNGNGKPIEAFRHIGNIYFDKLVNNKKAKAYYKKYVKAGGNRPEVKDRLAGI